MEATRIELYVSNKTRNYNDSIALQVLGKARRAGFKNGADLFTRAYASYDSELPEEFLNIHYVAKTSRRFLQRFQIKYKEDIYFYIRHPELQKENLLDDNQERQRKILIFNEDGQEEACTYLKKKTPRERTGAAKDIIEQFLIISNNEYYFDQTSARLFNFLCKNARFDEQGKVQGDIDMIINSVWLNGKLYDNDTERIIDRLI